MVPADTSKRLSVGNLNINNSKLPADRLKISLGKNIDASKRNSRGNRSRNH